MAGTFGETVNQGTLESCPICGSVVARVLRAPDGQMRLRRCRRCGAVYWEDVWDAEQVRRHYDDYYEVSDEVTRDPLTEQRYHSLLDRFERERGRGRLLDLGCGAGQLITVAALRGWEVTGLEVSASALACLNQLRAPDRSKVSIIQGDVLAARLSSRRFDIVTMIEVLEHLTAPLATLREVHRLLDNGGLLYLTTPNYNSLSRYLLGSRWRVIAGEHRCLLNPRAIRRCLAEIGFRCLWLRTKNIDLPAILATLRMLGGDSAAHPTHPKSHSQRFRHTLERVWWLRMARRTVNGALHRTGVGDTIEVLAVKQDHC